MSSQSFLLCCRLLQNQTLVVSLSSPSRSAISDSWPPVGLLLCSNSATSAATVSWLNTVRLFLLCLWTPSWTSTGRPSACLRWAQASQDCRAGSSFLT